MEEYIHGVKISEIKEIGNTGGTTNRAYFSITYKDDFKERFIIVTNDNTSFKELRKMKRKIYEAFNEYNNISESYLLENEVHICIDGEYVHFGTRCINSVKEYVNLTLKEIETLKKQSKIVDEGWRHLASCVLFEINNNKINKKVPKRYIEQLEYMGYDIDKLEYEIKE